ncbi:MAG: Hsp33 family molecular chaperone HslO [Solirubrobacterales bacterium]
MSKGDRIIRVINEEKTIRMMLAETTHLVEEARVRHDAAPTAAAALGRILTAAVMMASDMKQEESVTLRVNGGGPLGTILAVAPGDGTVRGSVSEPNVDVPEKYRGKLDVGAAVGTNGFFEVVRDMGLKAPFTGSVPLVSGELAEDLAYYFTLSEQVPSLVALGVYREPDRVITAAGGLIIQALPGADDDALVCLEERVSALGPITTMLQETESLEELAGKIMGPIPYRIIDERPLAFRCRCSEEKVLSIIRSMQLEDIEHAIREHGHLEVRCNFCNETYSYLPHQVETIRNQQATP